MTVSNGEATRVDIVMHLTFGAAVTVTGKYLWKQVKARQLEMRRVTSNGDPK